MRRLQGASARPPAAGVAASRARFPRSRGPALRAWLGQQLGQLLGDAVADAAGHRGQQQAQLDVHVQARGSTATLAFSPLRDDHQVLVGGIALPLAGWRHSPSPAWRWPDPAGCAPRPAAAGGGYRPRTSASPVCTTNRPARPRRTGHAGLRRRVTTDPGSATTCPASTDAGVHGVPGGQQVVPAQHPVFEAHRGPADPGQPGEHAQQIVVARRLLVADLGLHHRQEHLVLGLEIPVAQPVGAQELVPARLEIAEVIGVIHDPHLVGVAVDHPDVRMSDGAGTSFLTIFRAGDYRLRPCHWSSRKCTPPPIPRRSTRSGSSWPTRAGPRSAPAAWRSSSPARANAAR